MRDSPASQAKVVTREVEKLVRMMDQAMTPGQIYDLGLESQKTMEAFQKYIDKFQVKWALVTGEPLGEKP